MQPAHSVTKNEKSPATARSMRNCVSGWSTPTACAALTIAKWVSGVNGERNPAFAPISCTECACAGMTREMTSP